MLDPRRREDAMGVCDMCGNDYDKAFTVTLGGSTHTFDSFECAIHMLAPKCAHCSCRIIGHGLQSGSALYCCAHCAEASGIGGLRDRVGAADAVTKQPATS